MSRQMDKRRFGRRRSLIHALVITSKGRRIPCLVRNISVGGALLELEQAQLASVTMKLIIEADGFEADCEIRHKSEHGVGVYFRDVRIEANGRDTRLAGPKLETAMQNVTISELGRR